MPYITKIYNASLRNAIFPKAWKFGTVVPIPKQDNITEVTNLRPISLLPMPGKLLEKMVCNHLKQYLETNHILSECQFGFRKGMSTSNAISSLLDEIYNNLNNCKTTFAVFLDLKKAFDTVSHNVLYYKLSQIGLSDHSIAWFTSYLNNRWQRVNLNGSMSEYESNPYGVPQGSILGQVLFTIYINSLVQVYNHCKVSMYADDTVITCTDLASLQDELVKAVAWCGRNVLTLNSKKTKVMIFSPNRQYPANQINIKIQKETVEIVPKFKYLGLILDSKLSFQPHRADLIRRVQHKLYFLARIRCYLTTYAALLIYKTTILPLLDYADYIYNPETKYEENKLQLLQNKALRIVYKVQLGRDRTTRSNELHSRANIIHLKGRRKQHLLHYAFDLAQNPGNRDMRPINILQ